MKFDLSMMFKLMQFLPGVFLAIEALQGKTGKEKEDAAVAMIMQILQATEGVSGKDLIDDATVQNAARETFQAYAALDKAVKSYQAKRG